MFKWSFFLILVLEIWLVFGDENRPIVELENGKLRGKYMETRNGRKIEGFTSIPYAKPPLGELRFQPPAPVEPWDGVKDAFRIHPFCPQMDFYRRSTLYEGDEDCLYLNVYTPKSEERKEPLPVMFFIHPGGWLCGSGNEVVFGPGILLDKDVVLVSLNYRLGPLGLLSTEDDVVPGNMALKDQSLALKWVKENIEKFGGNPDKITVFGDSAGGASTQFHMVSPLSRDMMSAAISQSGSALGVWALAIKGESIAKAKKLAELVGCPNDDNKNMVECLRTVKAEDIIGQMYKFMKWDLDPIVTFKPVIEENHTGAFLTEHPIDSIKKGNIAKVPYMVGLTKEDGSLRSSSFFSKPGLVDDFNKNMDTLVPIILFADDKSKDIEGLSKKIKHFYFEDKKIDYSDKSRNAISNFHTDGWFLNAADETVRMHLKYVDAPIYYYLYAYRGLFSFTETYGDPDYDYGTCHGDDLLSLFPFEAFVPESIISQKDRENAKMMSEIWVNFAKYGNPTPEVNKLIPNIWKPVSSNKMEYYFFDNEKSVMKEGLLSERSNFWRTLDYNGRYVIKDEL